MADFDWGKCNPAMGDYVIQQETKLKKSSTFDAEKDGAIDSEFDEVRVVYETSTYTCPSSAGKNGKVGVEKKKITYGPLDDVLLYRLQEFMGAAKVDVNGDGVLDEVVRYRVTDTLKNAGVGVGMYNSYTYLTKSGEAITDEKKLGYKGANGKLEIFVGQIVIYKGKKYGVYDVVIPDSGVKWEAGTVTVNRNEYGLAMIPLAEFPSYLKFIEKYQELKKREREKKLTKSEEMEMRQMEDWDARNATRTEELLVIAALSEVKIAPKSDQLVEEFKK